MKKQNIVFSQYFRLKTHKQRDFEFVNVTLFKDTQLFFDPTLMEKLDDDWAREATEIIISFMKEIIKACEKHDLKRKDELLSYGKEPNETRLGYSRHQVRGNGATLPQLKELFERAVEERLFQEGLIKRMSDLPVFVKNFDKDRLSDLITNILRKHLYDFTVNQCEKWNIPLNAYREIGKYWDKDSKTWKTLQAECLSADGKIILLVPKQVVRTNLIASAQSYVKGQVMKEIKEQIESGSLKVKGIKADSNITSKELYDKLVKGQNLKEYARNYARANKKSLDLYREGHIAPMEMQKKRMSDRKLEVVVNGSKYKKDI